MTKSFKARYLSALKAHDAATTAVYEAGKAAGLHDPRLSEALAASPHNVAETYRATFSAMFALDHEADQSGRAFAARNDVRNAFYSKPR